VAQEPKLFDGTIRENLTLGLTGSEFTEDQVNQACRDAEIHDFIISLPDGYGTSLGTNASMSLSGGQKQRLCLARALLRRPSLLLLDEATSSLDSQSEKLVQTAIERLVGQRSMTVIAVAHRLATIQKADVIFVFGESEVGQGSRILEQGTHGDLLRRRGAYWQMCQEQALDR
jgi:ATP-binding cassette, subfamily B (MDR/TAP), member 1